MVRYELGLMGKIKAIYKMCKLAYLKPSENVDKEKF